MRKKEKISGKRGIKPYTEGIFGGSDRGERVYR
jgi:hypothetical protein